MKIIKYAAFISSLSFLFLIGCTENSDTETVDQSYSIGGLVSGLNGDSVVLQNNSADDTIIVENGEFTLIGQYSDQSSYHVTVSSHPSNPNQICSSTNNSGVINGANVDSIEVQCTNIYTIGGQLIDYYSSSPLFVSINGLETIELSTNGSFEFDTEIEDGANYDVAITIDSLPTNCVIVDGTGTVTDGPVTDIKIYCNGVPVSIDPNDRLTSFLTIIYQPVLRQHCSGCHEQGGPGVGRFADVNVETAFNDAIRLINVNNPAESRLITKVESGHSCWQVAGLIDCADNADTIHTAITTWIAENYY